MALFRLHAAVVLTGPLSKVNSDVSDQPSAAAGVCGYVGTTVFDPAVLASYAWYEARLGRRTLAMCGLLLF